MFPTEVPHFILIRGTPGGLGAFTGVPIDGVEMAPYGFARTGELKLVLNSNLQKRQKL